MDLRFGDPDETISSCLGRNYLMFNLTWAGKAMFVILDKLDPNHCIDAIEDKELYFQRLEKIVESGEVL